MKPSYASAPDPCFSDDRFEPAADLAERGSLAADAHGNRLSHVMPSIVLPGDD